MSEKRPETSADIISRSKALTGADVRRAEMRERRVGKHTGKRYSVDLASHMAECDGNYHKLNKLLPQLRDIAASQIQLLLENTEASSVAPLVIFDVLEKGPYTTLLKITLGTTDSQTPPDVQNRWMSLAAAPQMTVRVYHDARSAEVVSYQNENYFHGVYEYPNLRMRQRDEKVQLNRFLGEFLSICLQHGAVCEPISF